MPRRILVLGPHGAGKSTLVRQMMSLYERRAVIPGGVGALPLGYELHHVNRVPTGEGHHDEHLYGRLVVLGNYEETGRDRYGMHQFEKYRSNFEVAIKRACCETCPVLMEGGFTKLRRLATDEGKKLCDGMQIVWLSPDNSLRCARESVTKEQWKKSNEIAMAVAAQMTRNGAEAWATKHREDALKWVCAMIDDSLDYRKAKIFSSDYR